MLLLRVWLCGVFGLALGVLTAQASNRVWTSTAGTQVEAAALAVINGQVWLRPKAGGLLKVAREKLSEADRGYLDKRAQAGRAWVVAEDVPAFDKVDPTTVEMLETLTTVEVPSLELVGVKFDDALRRLSDAIAEAAPERRRVVFVVDPRCKAGTVTGLSMRESSGLRILELLCGQAAPEVVGTLNPTGIAFAPRDN